MACVTLVNMLKTVVSSVVLTVVSIYCGFTIDANTACEGMAVFGLFTLIKTIPLEGL